MTDNQKIQLQTEIEISKTIQHPNVISFIDVFEDEKHICLVLELMEGGDLFHSIIERQVFSESDARSAIKTIV